LRSIAIGPDRVRVDPVAVVEQRQDRERFLWRVSTPTAMVYPNIVAIVHAATLGPGRQDKDVLAVGNNAGMIVIGTPTFRAFAKVVFNHISFLYSGVFHF
jgi:hypothetical protein